VHMTMFAYRWMPYDRYVHDLVRDGCVGACHHAHFRFVMAQGRSPDDAWPFEAARANGALGNLGVHLIDPARWLVGDVRGVASRPSVVVQRSGADGGRLESANDGASLPLDFVGGVSWLVHASAVSHIGDRAFVQEVRLYGPEGTVEVVLPFAAARDQHRVDARQRRDGSPDVAAHHVPIEHAGDVSCAMRRCTPTHTNCERPSMTTFPSGEHPGDHHAQAINPKATTPYGHVSGSVLAEAPRRSLSWNA
jgi:predicted dehydrogenase